MYKPRYGDIVIVDYVFGEIQGCKHSDRVPALIVSNDEFNAASEIIMLCPILNADVTSDRVLLQDKQMIAGTVVGDLLEAAEFSKIHADYVEHCASSVCEKISRIIRKNLIIKEESFK